MTVVVLVLHVAGILLRFVPNNVSRDVSVAAVISEKVKEGNVFRKRSVS